MILGLGQSFYFLCAFFSPEVAMYQAEGEMGFGQIVRLAGAALAGQSVCNFLLARFGIRGLVDFRHPWRAFMFFSASALRLLGGFRSQALWPLSFWCACAVCF